MKERTRVKFPLLIYQTLSKRWFVSSVLLIPLGLLLWWSQRQSGPYAFAILFVPLAGVLLTIYTLLARNAAVVCSPKHFTVRTPLMPVVFSYRRVENVRPLEFAAVFPPLEEKGVRRRFYQNLWAKTAVVVDLKGYPVALWWLKLWFSPYLLHPQERALVLLVEEWMALVRQIEIRRAALQEGRHY
ncbi:MAG: hypothetical protein ACLFU8_02240 [Anaerolineales bacterium]